MMSITINERVKQIDTPDVKPEYLVSCRLGFYKRSLEPETMIGQG